MPIDYKELRNKIFNPTKYKHAIRSLLYPSLSTRPNILYSFSKALRKTKKNHIQGLV